MVGEKSKNFGAFLIRVEEFSHFMEASNIYRHRSGNIIRYLRRPGLYKPDHCLTVHENIKLYTHSVPCFDSYDLLGH